jgi:uncharacterized membrane protein (DUF106 family)
LVDPNNKDDKELVKELIKELQEIQKQIKESHNQIKDDILKTLVEDVKKIKKEIDALVLFKYKTIALLSIIYFVVTYFLKR